MAAGPCETEPAPVVVPERASFSGLVSFMGAARIDGRLDGRVLSRGRLVLAPSARVEGEIQVDELVVAGALDGVVRARRVELLPEARVRGALEAELVVLADGCRFDGTCRSGPGAGRGRDASEEPLEGPSRAAASP